jgi:hypothetical protein
VAPAAPQHQDAHPARVSVETGILGTAHTAVNRGYYTGIARDCVGCRPETMPVRYDAPMKRTMLSLPDDMMALLEREARRRDLSVSEVVRQALTAHFGSFPDQPRQLPFAALGHSGHRHTAHDLDAILVE